MKIMAVDDERLGLANLTSLLTETMPEAEVTGFIRPTEAFSYLSENKVDIAFLDIEMGSWSGIELAKKCKDICPQVNIIFVTGHSQYTMDAFKIHASGYLLKPVHAQDLKAEISNLRHPLASSSFSRVRVQTFGNFEIFVDDKPLKLPQAKCRECLAYLIDRKGARVTRSELASVLWEEKPYDRTTQNNLHRVISDLMKVLKEKGIKEILIKTRSELAINTALVDCDYYRAVSGDISRMNTFMGEYMSNYSWAEFTLGGLIQNKNK